MGKKIQQISKGIKFARLDIEETPERIFLKRRWFQVLVHSCIYYRLNTNIISDSKWNKWAKELYSMVHKYPRIAKSMPWSKELLKFNPATGFDLPMNDPWVLAKAQQLVDIFSTSEQKKQRTIRLDFRRKKK